MFNHLFTSDSIKTIVRVVALVIVLYVMVNALG